MMADEPVQPPQPADQPPPAASGSAPEVDSPSPNQPPSVPVSPRPAEPSPVTPPPVSRHHSLIVLKVVGLLFGIVLLVVGGYLGGQQVTKRGTSGEPTSNVVPTDSPDPKASGKPAAPKQQTVSCTSQTGPDATTTSQQFVDIEGTNCSYRSSSLPETLLLSGKLTGRNTGGTGMSVTLNVNGKDCQGGEALNYSTTWVPMTSFCTFSVPANSAITIKWRFLSPFGGTASVLRSSANIAPYINGLGVPQ